MNVSDKSKKSETIADQIRQAIRDSEWSLNSIAKESGIPQPYLWRFMNGAGLSLKAADRLCAHFGMKLTRPRKNMK